MCIAGKGLYELFLTAVAGMAKVRVGKREPRCLSAGDGMRVLLWTFDNWSGIRDSELWWEEDLV
jgi:hypothetical protein